MRLLTRIFLFVALVSAGLTQVSCSSSTSTPPQKSEGGQDGGGGTLRGSTADEVRKAIAKAYELGTSENLRRNVFVRFWRANGYRAYQHDEIVYPERLFPGLRIKDEEPQDDTFDLKKFESAILQKLRHSKPHLLEVGDCIQPDQAKHAAASVSKLNLEGTVCFSIENIMRVAPEDLLKEVLSLLLHEAIHLGGGSENEAKAWQEEFASFFVREFNVGVNPIGLFRRSRQEIVRIQDAIAKTIELNREFPADPRIYGRMGMIKASLDALPNFLDPIMLEIGMEAEYPWRIDNYSNAVLATIEKIEMDFQLADSEKFGNFNQLTGVEIDKSLANIEEYVNVADANLVATKKLKRYIINAKARCILPTHTLEIKGPAVLQHPLTGFYLGGTSLSREVPPLECAKEPPTPKGAP